MPEKIDLIICDFDGVLTDNRVWVDQDGKESVAAFRSDSLRVKELRSIGIEVMILSSEPNPVVRARAKKMGVESIHGIGINDKGRVMQDVLAQKKIQAGNVIYIGNDINDLPCFEVAGWSVAVADAFPEVLRAADHVLVRTGGHGALRELCDLLLKNK
jgi:N-acylneuraminate cytidylyltransferase